LQTTRCVLFGRAGCHARARVRVCVCVATRGHRAACWIVALAASHARAGAVQPAGPAPAERHAAVLQRQGHQGEAQGSSAHHSHQVLGSAHMTRWGGHLPATLAWCWLPRRHLIAQVFSYGSVGGGLLSDKYVEAEPKKGLFGEWCTTGRGAGHTPHSPHTHQTRVPAAAAHARCACAEPEHPPTPTHRQTAMSCACTHTCRPGTLRQH
jgi:hypothetical protein